MPKRKLNYPTVTSIVGGSPRVQFKVDKSETLGVVTEVLVEAIIPLSLTGDLTFESFINGLNEQGFIITNADVLNEISKAFEEGATQPKETLSG